MGIHSDYSPSRLKRIIACPGSVNLIKTLQSQGTIPEEEEASSYALHGTMLHERIAPWLEKNSNTAYPDLSLEESNVLKDCLEYAQTILMTTGPWLCKVESEVTLDTWGVPEVYGTLDLSYTNTTAQHVNIIDWKFGSGVIVYAKNNPQLLAYAAGAVKWPTDIKTITLHIFQPYLDHVSTWDITIAELHKWVFGTLAPAVFEAKYGAQTISPSDEACRWCEAKNHCEARLALTKVLATEIFEAHAKLPNKIKPEDLVHIISMAPLVEKAIKDIKLFVKTEIERGMEYEGLKLVRGRANRSWKDESATIKWLAGLESVEDIFNSKLKSPSQLEKADRNLKKNKYFQDLYHKPEGKATLVFASDPRPAVSNTSAAVDVFRSYTNPDKLS